jgi:hypothetical protein
MQPTKELIDALEREEIEDARRMSVEQKLLLGGDLFDAACDVTLSGIRIQHPGINDADAMDELRRRLELGHRLETRL